MESKAIQSNTEPISIELDKLNLDSIYNLISTYFENGKFVIPKINVDTKIKEKLNKQQEIIPKIYKPIYGINTGFGKLYDKIIDSEDLQKLQYNLIYSHYAGYGKPISKFIVFLTILIRLNQLSLGYGGISYQLIEKVIDFLEKNDLHEIPNFTSVGASGDLIPLAHIFFKLIQNYQPKPKESLAFINGTSFSLSNFILSLFLIDKLLQFSNFLVILSSIANNINLNLHFSIKLLKTKPNKYFAKVNYIQGRIIY